MRIPSSRTRRSQTGGSAPRPRRRVLLGVSLPLLGFLGWLLWFLVAIDLIPTPRAALYDWSMARGHQVYGQKSLRQVLPQAAGRWLAPVEIPRLVIDIKFTDMEFLYARRAEALRTRTLIQETDDYVPASIRHGNENTRVRLRLKGDFTDHLDSEKWSFRVHVRDGGHIFGMRRFSLQHPKVRGYQGEALFFEYLRKIGVLAPRYFFVHVTVNGNDVGIMAVEEHFSKELLESQNRREGVIVRFDESLFWKERLTRGIDAWRHDTVMSYTNSTIDVFRGGAVAESPALSANLETAVELLRGVVEGTVAPSDAFDVEQLGKFVAACELWTAPHALYWNNLRFYLNPVSLRLEPIAFDADVTDRPGVEALIARQNPFSRRCLEDPLIQASYERWLRRLATGFSDSLTEELVRAEGEHLPILQKEFVLLEPYPLDLVRERAVFLSAADLVVNDEEADVVERYPSLIQAFLVADEESSQLEIASIVPERVRVQSARWVSADGDSSEGFEFLGGAAFPLQLPATARGSVPQALRLAYAPPTTPGFQLEFVAHVEGQEATQLERAIPYRRPADEHPLTGLTALHPLDAHPFLRIDAGAKEIRVERGDWRVEGSLVVPPGFRLIAEAGTRLAFQPGEALIALGPVDLLGTAEEPIVLEGRQDGASDSGWQGVVVLQDGHGSQWSHVVVRNTTGVDRASWTLTGGVTFQRGEVRLSDCSFHGNRAEDALNIINGQFELTDISIHETISDGLDIDFGAGIIRNASFHNIGAVSGGDAADFSGARVRIEGAVFEGVQDKALSVGEGSSIEATNLQVTDAGVGVATKDGSTLQLSDSLFQIVRHAGLMAYVKKPVFGPGSIRAHNLRFVDAPLEARVQTGSLIEIDGQAVKTEDIDVEELYGTIMQPGLRQ